MASSNQTPRGQEKAIVMANVMRWGQILLQKAEATPVFIIARWPMLCNGDYH